MKKHIKQLQSALEAVIEHAPMTPMNRIELPNVVLDFQQVATLDDKPAYRNLIETLDKIEGAPEALAQAKRIVARSLRWFTKREREAAEIKHDFSLEARAHFRQ